jgi:hypothetical protein
MAQPRWAHGLWITSTRSNTHPSTTGACPIFIKKSGGLFRSKTNNKKQKIGDCK